MGRIRNNYGSEFKAKVSLKALKEDSTLEQLSSTFGVSSSQTLIKQLDAISSMF